MRDKLVGSTIAILGRMIPIPELTSASVISGGTIETLPMVPVIESNRSLG
jgi:hypothetical protein